MTTRIKLNEFSINDETPWENDLLDREKEIRSLTKIVSSIEPPFVLSLNSNWGKGKTTFIKLWEAHLRETNLESIYFNAWETDFSEEPLISFLGEINDKLSTALQGDSKLIDKWEKTKELGASISRKALPSIIRIMTSGIVNIGNKDFDEFFSGLTESIASESLASYLEKKTEIKKFKEYMEEIINDGLEDKLIIFVDELDRCRPDYAVELLERIKHLFNVDGLVFVLSVAKGQLCSSIKKIYGSEIDAEEYLKKFIDIEYHLVDPEKSKFVDGLITSYGIDEFILNAPGSEEANEEEVLCIKNIVLSGSHHKGSTLRDISQVVGSINVAVRSAGNSEKFPYCLLAFLTFLKVDLPDIYNKIKLGGMSGAFLNYFDSAYRPQEFSSNGRYLVESQYHILLKLSDIRPRPKRIEQFFNDVNRGNVSNDRELYDFKRKVLESYRRDEESYGHANLADIFGLVEFSSHFD